MRDISIAFKKAVYEEGKSYQCRAVITLLNDVELELDNSKIMYGGIEFTDAVTSDGAFDALGSAIINSFSLTVDNSTDAYSQYDFLGAQVEFYIGIDDVQEICIGTYSIEDTSYNDSTIVLYCLDNMVKFDKPYSNSTLVYPATLQTIVLDLCTVCGVILDTNYYNFPHYNYVIETRPNDSSITCREVLSSIATMCGCFARCDNYGNLQLKWFDITALNSTDLDGGIFDSATPYATGDTATGGAFSPWNTGEVIDAGTFVFINGINFIYALASQSISIEDVTITGVKITVQNNDPESESSYVDYTVGSEPYCITVTDNLFINQTNVTTVLDWLGNALIGITFRPLTVSHLSDIAIEAGDVAIVSDRKGNRYKTLITSTLFKINSYQTSKCCAESTTKKASTRYTAEEKNYSVTKEMIQATNDLSVRAYQLATQIDATAVTNVVVEYAKSTSPADQPTTGWSSDSPVWEAGYYIWQRTKTTINGEDIISNVSCIQGARGDDGTSVTILGSYNTYAELIAAHPTGNLGDSYLVAGDLYVWDGTQWLDVGTIQGPQGPQGIQGNSLVSITEYYARNNSTTAPADSAFSTSITTPTASYKYVWNYELMRFSDNSTSRTTKHIIAVYGDKGDKGNTGKALSSITEYYARSTSNTTAPADSAFSTSVITPTASYKYVWNYEVLTWNDNGVSSTTRTAKHVIAVYGDKGQQGAQGISVSSIVPQYYLSTSSSSATGGTWQESPPAYIEGYYYFTRSKITFSNGNISYAPSEAGVLDNAITDANSAAYQALRAAGDAEDIANATAQYFWTDDDGVHIASEADTPNATRNTLWNSLGMLFRKGINIILAITTGTNPSIDFYDGTGNDATNVIASFGGSNTRIGKTNNIHTTIGSNSFAISAPYDLNVLNVYGEQVNNQRAFLISGTSDQSQINTSIPSDVKIITGSQIVIYAKKLSDSSYTASATFTYGTADSKTSNGYTFAYNGAKTFAVSKTSSVGDINITFMAAELSNCKFILGTLASSPASSGNNIFSFGSNNVVQGNNAIAFGSDCKASGNWAVAVGWQAQATYEQSLAFQRGKASALYSFAAGDGQAKKKYSVAFGEDTVANGEHQVVLGKFNIADTSSLLIIGNGTSERSNAFKLSEGGTGYFASALGTGGKTAWNDTNKGCWLTSNGNIHLMDSATSGGAIGFHFNFSASATTTLHEPSAGVLTCTARLQTKDWSGSSRTPVSSATTDGGRISYIQATAASLRVAGQWGTAGGSYTITDFLPPTSDVRLKKNVEDCEVDSALDIINQIRLHSFDWLHTDEHQKIGFIADELEQIDPKLSVGGGAEKDGTVHYKTVDTFYMMGYLVKAIQEQQKQIQQLQAEITELKKGGTQ